ESADILDKAPFQTNGLKRPRRPFGELARGWHARVAVRSVPALQTLRPGPGFVDVDPGCPQQQPGSLSLPAYPDPVRRPGDLRVARRGAASGARADAAVAVVADGPGEHGRRGALDSPARRLPVQPPL